MTDAALRMTWHRFHWYEAVSSAFNFPFLKEVSQNCSVFDVLRKLRKSRRLDSFLTLSSSKIELVSRVAK